ncbi:hypothetical protein ACOSQ4_033079 [Xanthoceras sorbifolium]
MYGKNQTLSSRIKHSRTSLHLLSVYVSQSLHFRSPVYVGEEIAGEVQAINTRENNNRYIVKFSTKCVKNNCELIVLDGEAMAILLTLTTEQVSSMSTADRIEY